MTTPAEPAGGSLVTRAMLAPAALVALAGLLILWRLVVGLGPTTALNDGYPLGLWIAFDVVTGTALACGGYAVAILLYVLNKGRYHPLIRPAILTSALGYSIAGFSVAIDIGRWWNIWKVPLYFRQWNFDSALLEIALCIMAYVVVLWIELSPAFFEKFADGSVLWLRRLSRRALPILERTSIAVIALGLVLPTMHQSSLGTLMLLAGSRLHPLWRTPMLPLLFLLTCVSMGYAVVVCESAFSAVAFKRPVETVMLSRLARAIVPIQAAAVTLRVADWWIQGAWSGLAIADSRSLLAMCEVILWLAPLPLLWTSARRRDLGGLVRAAIVMMFAGALFRFDTYLAAFLPGAHWSYFPSVTEILITTGLLATEIVANVV
ncbi:MAG TPA: Ni/Fe-hydrogenase cytochrome b subunit, partial [Vicinamibacterales bacterium]|nr:Ni/Fe-hydrogenase cytochrome b subunit [Vicinamibacterales bacterium]